MCWIGLIFLGAVIGAAGWWLHPLRWVGRVGNGVAGASGPPSSRACSAISSTFITDGDSLEWLSCSLFALVLVTLTVALASRR